MRRAQFVKTLRLLAFGLLVGSLAGGARKGAGGVVPESPNISRASSPQILAIQTLNRRGLELFHRGRYEEASEIFQQVFGSAQSLHRPDLAERALGDWGGCQFLQHQYQAALRSFLEAYRMAESGGDNAGAAGWEANIGSLYMEMGETRAAGQWIEQSLKRMPAPEKADHLPQLQIQLASLRAHNGEIDKAAELFQQGIDGADRAGDAKLYAIGLNRFGEAYLSLGDIEHAEALLLKAYYVRKLNHLPLDSSYRSLGRLRLAQGDLVSASTLLDRAVELAAKPQGPIPTWDVYQWRARVRMAQGRLPEALHDLRIALRLGRAWRWATPANDALRIGTEGLLEEVHSALVEAGNRLYLTAGDPALVHETFEAVEENRAASLRAFQGTSRSDQADLPPQYWQALARLQKAEVAALRNGSTSGLETARADLIRLEASLGGNLPSLPSNLVEAARQALKPDQALFSFSLGPAISWVWALDSAGLAVYALPPRSAIDVQVRETVTAIRESRPDAPVLSGALYRALFGVVAPRFKRAQHWLVALDDALFDIPLAALIESTDPQPVYAVEHHTIERIPGVAYWLDSAEKGMPQLSPLFVGLGDAIYNPADTRLKTGSPAKDALPLPRLVGSASEIESCARAWGGPSVILSGTNASRTKLVEQIERHPAAIHLATHYLESPSQSRDGLIALSLNPAGHNELLTAFEISRWHVQTGLVVLSGCHSAAGAALPGTGVLGLTRAWLAAGARAVVASLWAVPDDEGNLFRPLYASLHSRGWFAAAEALRDAQLRMLHSGGIFARPAYWGAYMVVGAPGKAALVQ